MSKRNRSNHTVDMGPVDKLIGFIRSLHGDKIVTLVGSGGAEMTIDVDADGTFGYSEGHFPLFKARLARAMTDSGALTIRVFEDRRAPSGLPYKRLYGFFIGGGAILPQTAEQLRKAFSVDFKTGAPIEPEPEAIYCDSRLE